MNNWTPFFAKPSARLYHNYPDLAHSYLKFRFAKNRNHGEVEISVSMKIFTIKLVLLVATLALLHSLCTNKREYKVKAQVIDGRDSLPIWSLEKIKNYDGNGKKVVDENTTVCKIKLSPESDTYIVKLYYDGFDHYLFWKKENDQHSLILQDSIPSLEFYCDSLLDINGDSWVDFVIYGEHINGKYAHAYCMVFCYDSTNSNFVYVPAVADIRNPNFLPEELKIIECQPADTLLYTFTYSWVNRFEVRCVDSSLEILNK